MRLPGEEVTADVFFLPTDYAQHDEALRHGFYPDSASSDGAVPTSTDRSILYFSVNLNGLP